MWSILLFTTLLFVVGLLYGIVKTNGATRIGIVLLGLLLAASLGFFLGQGAERLNNYSQYVFRFGQYSQHIRGLAERQQIQELTNAVIFFDKKFYPKHDVKEIEDAVFQLLRLGAYAE